jgi:hypothetical protein
MSRRALTLAACLALALLAACGIKGDPVRPAPGEAAAPEPPEAAGVRG